MVRFSFVIPVYNVEKYLNECVDSILSQTYTDFEIILVDDGSKDNSSKICDEYAQKDNRIKVIHKVNGGQSSARNLGVSNACGEYIVFLDSDDFICDRDFLKDLDRASQKGYDIIAYKYSKFFNKDKIVPINVSYSNLDKDYKNAIKDMVKIDGFFCSCWTKATKRSILVDNNITFNENLNCEDMDWYLSVIEKAKSITAIDKNFIMYRQRENSVTSTFKPKTMSDYVFTLNKWSDNFSKIEDKEFKYTLLSALGKLYCNLIISYSRNVKIEKNHKKEIYSLKYLLKYDLNPRTKKFNFIRKIIGVRGLILFLRIIGRVR